MTGYRVEPARAEHVEALPAIERAAAALFEAYDLGVDPDDVTPPDDLEQARREGQLWVALSREGRVVGFALVHRHAGGAHLEEMDVHPDHGRRGLGTRLVRTVCDWARGEGLGLVTLTTFRDVPWNAPFYRRLGFEEIPQQELHPELREILDEESQHGLPLERRVAMRRRL